MKDLPKSWQKSRIRRGQQQASSFPLEALRRELSYREEVAG